MYNFYPTFDPQELVNPALGATEFDSYINELLQDSPHDAMHYSVPDIPYSFDLHLSSEGGLHMNPFSPPTSDSASSFLPPCDVTESLGTVGTSPSAESHDDLDVWGGITQVQLTGIGGVYDSFTSPYSYSSDELVNLIAMNEVSFSANSDVDSLAIATELNPSEREIADMQPPTPLEQGQKRKFKCPKCTKTILWKNRKEHMKTHDPNRLLFCCSHPHCWKSYTRRNDLKDHTQEHHPGQHLMNSAHAEHHRPLYCDACRKYGFRNEQQGCECGGGVIFTF